MEKTKIVITNGVFEGLDEVKASFDELGKTEFDVEFQLPATLENFNAEDLAKLVARFREEMSDKSYSYDVKFNFKLLKSGQLSERDKDALLKLNSDCKKRRLGEIFLSENKKGARSYSLEQTIKAGQKLDNVARFVKTATKINENGEAVPLSVYEKYLLIYSYVTQFIYHEENSQLGQHMDISRHYIPILTGDKIVCVGYVDLLQRLCDKVFQPTEIKVSQLSVDLTTNEFKHHAFHRMGFVYINDKEYGIRGVFATDPTNDSQAKNFLQGIALSAYPIVNDLLTKDFQGFYDSNSIMHRILFVKNSEYQERCLKYFEKSNETKFGSPFYMDYSVVDYAEFVRDIVDPEMAYELLGVERGTKLTPMQKSQIKQGVYDTSKLEIVFEKLIKTPEISIASMLSALNAVADFYENKGMVDSRETFILDTIQSSSVRAGEIFKANAPIVKTFNDAGAVLEDFYGKKGKVEPKTINRAFIENYSGEERVEDLDKMMRETLTRMDRIKLTMQHLYDKLSCLGSFDTELNVHRTIPEELMNAAVSSDNVFSELANIAMTGVYTQKGKKVSLTFAQRRVLYMALLKIAEGKNREDVERFGMNGMVQGTDSQKLQENHLNLFNEEPERM